MSTETLPTTDLQRFFELSLSLLCTAEAGSNRFKDLNPAWETTLGWSRDELRARPFTDFIHPDDLQPTFDIITDMAERGLPAVNFENRYLHKDGHWVWLSWVGMIRDGMFYSSARDVSDYVQKTAQVRTAHAELSQFAYAASHDLQEPLRAITSYLGLVDSSSLDEGSRSAMAQVREGAVHMQRLIDGLISVSGVETEGRDLDPVALHDVVSRALGALAQQIADSAADITVGPLPTVAGDDDQLATVFEHVIGNAIKYARQGEPPRATIETTDEGVTWLLEVTDQGVGIVPERAERAFQIFQRLHRRSEYDGVGVGLSLCRRIVERHGGRMWMKGAEGEGVTVSIRLPKMPAPAEG